MTIEFLDESRECCAAPDYDLRDSYGGRDVLTETCVCVTCGARVRVEWTRSAVVALDD